MNTEQGIMNFEVSPFIIGYSLFGVRYSRNMLVFKR